MSLLQNIARPKGPHLSTNPEVFRIDASPVKGGGMACFATRDLLKSEMVLTVQDPVASVILNKFKKEVCAWCYCYHFGATHKIKLEVAKGRGVAWFCQLSCRNSWMMNIGESGWEAIRAFEEGLGRTRTPAIMGADESCDLEQVEGLWKIALQEGDCLIAQRLAKPRRVPQTATLPAEVDIDDARFILSSCISFSESEELVEEVRNMVPTLRPYTTSKNTLLLHIKIYHYILSILPTTSLILPFVTPINIMILMTRDAGNSWGVWDKSLAGEELFAYCTYPGASSFNHSCNPNVLKERVGRIYEFRAKDMLIKGTELNVSYLGAAESELGWQKRQEILFDGWGFVCSCSRCLREMVNI